MTYDDITWNGRTYRRAPEHPKRHRRVYYMATTAPRTYLHRDVYEAHHGPIPAGWHVHHIDGDPLNNAPSNLEALHPSAHMDEHNHQIAPTVATCHECGREFDALRQWAKWCSPACKERWRRREGVAYVKPTTGPYLDARSCEHCGNDYIAKRPWARFCSSACKQRAARLVAA